MFLLDHFPDTPVLLDSSFGSSSVETELPDSVTGC